MVGHTPCLIVYSLLCVATGEGLTDHRIDRWANELRIQCAPLGTAVVQVCKYSDNYFKHSILSTCLRNSYRGIARMPCRAKENKQQSQRNLSFCVLWRRLAAIYRSVSTLVLFPWRLHWKQTIDDPFLTQERRVKYTKLEEHRERCSGEDLNLKGQATAGWRKIHSTELYDLYSHKYS